MTGTITIDPIGKPRQTQRDKWKQRPVVMRYRAFCDTVRAHFGGRLEDIHGITIKFYIPMADSWSNKKKGKMVGTQHRQKPDIDNLAKSFMDAILKDDSCVSQLSAEKVWASTGSITYTMTRVSE